MIATQPHELENLRMAGKLLAEVLQGTAALVREGVTAAELDLAAEKMIREKGCVPAFLGYKPDGAAYPYPAALCVCVNDEVVHGIPTAEKILKNGDIVMLDTGLSYRGYFSDAAITLCVGECDEKATKLLSATREALAAAIAAVRPGAHIGDIGSAIQAVAKKHGLGVVEELGGHALGTEPHEQPFIPNVGRKGTGEKLALGMVLALEPILTEGSGDVVLGDDEWTYRTFDGSRSAEFEHTILVTKDGAEILTLAEK